MLRLFIRVLLIPCVLLAMPLLVPAQDIKDLEGFKGRLSDVPFTIAADEIAYDAERGIYEASGDVLIEHPEGGTLQADWLAFNATTRVGVASGNVRIRDGEDTIEASFAAVDLESLIALATDAVLDSGEAGFVVEGDAIHKTGVNTYRVEEGTFTTCRCPPGSGCRPWELDMREADVRVGGYAVAEGAKFKVRDVPIFYVPYLVVPVKTERQTGFLIPSMSSDSRGGQAFELPFFWAAADNVNLTFRPTYYTKRGFKHKADTQYVFGEKGEGEGGVTFLPGDDTVESTDPETPFSDDRWAYWLRHHHPLAEGVRVGTDLKRVSDNSYVVDFEDLPTESRFARFLPSSGWAAAGRGGLYGDATALYIDDLQSPEDIDRDAHMLHRLPDAHLATLPRKLMDSLPLRFGMASRYIYFYQKDDDPTLSAMTPVAGQFFDTGEDGVFDAEEPTSAGVFNGADNHTDNFATTGGTEGDGVFQEGELLADDGHRIELSPRVSLPVQYGIFEGLGELGFNETIYVADRGGTEAREIWNARFDVRTRFERDYGVGSVKLRHLIEPKVAFALVDTPGQTTNPLFVPKASVRSKRLIDEDIRLLSRNPSDRIGDERLLQYSLSSRLFARTLGDDKRPRVIGRMRVGSGYDFEDSRMSDIFVDAFLSPRRGLKMNFDMGFDPKDARVDEASAGFSWRQRRDPTTLDKKEQRGHELAINYRFLDDVNPGFENFNTRADGFEDFDSDFDRVSQLSARAVVVLTKQFELFGDGYMSLEDSSTNAGLFGVLFRSKCDCWGVVTQLDRRGRPAETRFEVRVHISGFGETFGSGFGTSYQDEDRVQ